MNHSQRERGQRYREWRSGVCVLTTISHLPLRRPAMLMRMSFLPSVYGFPSANAHLSVNTLLSIYLHPMSVPQSTTSARLHHLRLLLRFVETWCVSAHVSSSPSPSPFSLSFPFAPSSPSSPSYASSPDAQQHLPLSHLLSRRQRYPRTIHQLDAQDIHPLHRQSGLSQGRARLGERSGRLHSLVALAMNMRRTVVGRPGCRHLQHLWHL